MIITTNGDTMISDCVPVVAHFSQDAAADGNGAWVVSWIPGRLYDRNSAITALSLAEAAAEAANGDGTVWEANSRTWTAELNLTGTKVQELLAPVLGEKPAATRGE